ncbi:carboxylesterase/lipase family protein [Enterobacter asburiae]|uniref:carboxylesterase/lipase family protein n=1 Tax=Enterobacter asburiae TaxID=61645 RepID=UPI001FFECE79|nr:carboxylesterase family protein [Enterobacter asburiae]MCK2177853.1 carboxylesterase family protein [Enterobacter asburiae]
MTKNIKKGIVRLNGGTLIGNAIDANGVVSFKGVRYAMPPVGDFRWKAPQPVKAWKGEVIAKQFGYKSWQSPIFGGKVVTEGVSEDCLFLNIWVSPNRGHAQPVMVFIHGGGFNYGCSSDPDKDGTSLAKKGVVVVTINYRLGIFGFLSHPWLDKESNEGGSGMYGILDQIHALKWIKDNIVLFGGDPNNVTIFGESAGAHSVGILMASPLARGLFHKAIGQSGAFWESENGVIPSKLQAQTIGKSLSEKLGAKTLSDLRILEPDILQDMTNWTLQTDPSVSNFSPSLDGYVLPNAPYLQFQHGLQSHIPLLVGWNGDEGEMFMSRAVPHSSSAEFSKFASKIFGVENMSEFSRLYPHTTDTDTLRSAQLLCGDQVISFQTWSWANVHRATGGVPVFVYHFNPVTPYTPKPLHTYDVPYVFGNLISRNDGRQPNTEDWELSEVMQDYWTNFAKTSNPNSHTLPFWPLYQGAGSQVMRFAQTIEAGNEEGTERFEFLNTFRDINGLLTMGKSPVSKLYEK